MAAIEFIVCSRPNAAGSSTIVKPPFCKSLCLLDERRENGVVGIHTRFRGKYMKVKFLCLLSVLFLGTAAFAQSKPDPEISKMVKEVSSKNIEGTIRKLVSFGTRNTLSEQNDPNRGVGAARDWIYSEFQRISGEC